jgi:hypothetical protein
LKYLQVELSKFIPTSRRRNCVLRDVESGNHRDKEFWFRSQQHQLLHDVNYVSPVISRRLHITLRPMSFFQINCLLRQQYRVGVGESTMSRRSKFADSQPTRKRRKSDYRHTRKGRLLLKSYLQHCSAPSMIADTAIKFTTVN